jgi:putative salt-induced outer membrane protein
MSFYFGGGNNTSQSTTALTTKIVDALAARVSFDIKKETSPSPGAKKTDTASRATLVYGF